MSIVQMTIIRSRFTTLEIIPSLPPTFVDELIHHEYERRDEIYTNDWVRDSVSP